MFILYDITIKNTSARTNLVSASKTGFQFLRRRRDSSATQNLVVPRFWLCPRLAT